jgi:SulP family sulfate permease
MARAFLHDRWLPKSVLCLRNYDRHKFLLDLIAGVTVGLVALPLAMAFSIASGLTPQAGIYCAIVTGFLISALGGSKTQIGGPTGAFVVVVAGIVAVHGVDGLFMCTVMAGVLLVIMGITGLGTAVKFIPRPVVIGFTNGIAVLIASTQVKDFFGLHLDKVPGVFWLRIEALANSFHTLSFEATALAGFTLLVLIVCRSLSPRIPGPIVALLLATCANDRHEVWRNPRRPSSSPDTKIPYRPHSWLARPRFHRRHAGRHRIAHVGRGLRPDD